MHSPGLSEAFCVGASCPGSSGSQPPMPPASLLSMASLKVQLFKRYLDIEGIPGEPEQQAQGQDQRSCVDKEVPVV